MVPRSEVTHANLPISSDVDDLDWADRTAKIRAAHAEIVERIEHWTGRKGVEGLAAWVESLLIANQGQSNMDDVRAPCWLEHAPMTVQQYAKSLTGPPYNRSVDDPTVQKMITNYKQQLQARFGL